MVHNKSLFPRAGFLTLSRSRAQESHTGKDLEYMDGVVGQSPEEDVRGGAREDAVEADLVPGSRRGEAWRERGRGSDWGGSVEA